MSDPALKPLFLTKPEDFPPLLKNLRDLAEIGHFGRLKRPSSRSAKHFRAGFNHAFIALWNGACAQGSAPQPAPPCVKQA